MGRTISGIPNAPLRTLFLSAHWSLNQDEKRVLCSEALFCTQRSPRSWKVFILNYGDVSLSTSVLVKFHLRRALIKEYTGQSMSSKRGRGWRKDLGDTQGAVLLLLKPTDQSHPQPFYPLSTHPSPWCLHTYIYIVVSWVMGQSIPFFFQHNSWDKQLLLVKAFLKLRSIVKCDF